MLDFILHLEQNTRKIKFNRVPLVPILVYNRFRKFPFFNLIYFLMHINPYAGYQENTEVMQLT